jgi:ElaB/YqjD/DUF883 family membrane-anchored ribosome-binding protein
MESNSDASADQIRASGRRAAADFSGGTENVKSVASSEIKNLIADVEDLVARIADMKDADVVRIRSRVQNAVAAAKDALSNGTGVLRRQAKQVASTADSYVRESPWQALGVAALAGVVVGLLATRRTN